MLTITKDELHKQMFQIFAQIEASGEEALVVEHNQPILRILPIENGWMPKVGNRVEEVFADIYGQVEFLEDPDTPTTEEWDLLQDDEERE